MSSSVRWPGRKTTDYFRDQRRQHGDHPAAANVAKALKGRGADVGVTMVARAVNSVGLGMIGGGSLEEALDELESGAADAVIVLENDLHRHASAARVDAALSKAPLVMVVDHQRTAIMDKAHWCSPQQALRKATVPW